MELDRPARVCSSFERSRRQSTAAIPGATPTSGLARSSRTQTQEPALRVEGHREAREERVAEDAVHGWADRMHHRDHVLGLDVAHTERRNRHNVAAREPREGLQRNRLGPAVRLYLEDAGEVR